MDTQICRWMVLMSAGLLTGWGCDCQTRISRGGSDAGGGEATDGGGEPGQNDGGSNGHSCTQPTSLTISPPTTTAALSLGVPFRPTFTANAGYSDGSSRDVTSECFFSLDDGTFGAFTGSTLDWSGKHGGSVTVTASTCGAVAAPP